MTKLPTKCKGCSFVTTNDCTCQRCTAVKAAGWCNSNCHDNFIEEMTYMKRRLNDGKAA